MGTEPLGNQTHHSLFLVCRPASADDTLRAYQKLSFESSLSTFLRGLDLLSVYEASQANIVVNLKLGPGGRRCVCSSLQERKTCRIIRKRRVCMVEKNRNTHTGEQHRNYNRCYKHQKQRSATEALWDVTLWRHLEIERHDWNEVPLEYAVCFVVLFFFLLSF